jgi:propionyl-CoA carboxylase alpha chain
MAIRRLLVANRGEIARRVFRTCREMGIGTAAVFAESDANAPFVREADVAISLNGITGAETYLNIEKVISAARRAGADAVHPGYGFLSENATFAESVLAAGLTWVGPHPAAIAAMGDKLSSKQLVASAGVPVLPSVDASGLGAAELARRAAEIGYPVLVKASGGGGGRGMRIVPHESLLAESVASAQREAANAFANDVVFIEPYLEASRHVEVQVFGDKHGNAVHCFERECSIQRRHQKIIEEAPSPVVDPGLRQRMGETAVAVARAIGYDNAGTVEFLVAEDGQFYFLEMNTRLQVEHPVTEAITGLDLVREQIRVAEGEALSFRQEQLAINGHAIEARLYAEDPERDFLPSSGTVILFEPERGIPIRMDSGVESGSVLSIHFDPMLAKVIAHAQTRQEAALRLANALAGLRIPGVITNRDFLVCTLRDTGFLKGETTTAFIEKFAPARRWEPDPEELTFALLAAAFTGRAKRNSERKVLRTIPAGWRNNRSSLESVSYLFRGDEIKVGYGLNRDGSFTCTIGEASHHVRCFPVEGSAVVIEVDGVRRRATVLANGADIWVQLPAGQVALVEMPRFPEATSEDRKGGYTAPMPGKVIALHAGSGDMVSAGDLLIVLEAMKMEHRIVAASDGVVLNIRVAVGDQVEAGQLLVVMEGEANG